MPPLEWVHKNLRKNEKALLLVYRSYSSRR